jgi:hypothetical protein
VRILRQIAVGIYLIVFLLASGVAIRLFAVGVPLPPTSLPSVPPDSITAASESLFLFLSSSTADQCALFVQEAPAHNQSLDAFILHRVPQNVLVKYTRSDSPPPATQESFVHWFELEFEKERRRFDVAVYPTPSGYKIDWMEFYNAYNASSSEVAGHFKAPPAPIPGIH